MFLATADCMALKGTVVPFSSETEVPPAAAGAGFGGDGAAFGGAVPPFDATAAEGGGGGGAVAAADPEHSDLTFGSVPHCDKQ